MSKIKSDINGSYQDYFDKDLSLRDPDLYNSIKYFFHNEHDVFFLGIFWFFLAEKLHVVDLIKISGKQKQRFFTKLTVYGFTIEQGTSLSVA